MKTSSRLISLLLVLGIYVIASSSFFTKLLLHEPLDSGDWIDNEILVVDESDDGESTDAQETNDDDPANDTTEDATPSNPFTCNTQDQPDTLPQNNIVRRSLHGVIIGAQKGGTQALHKILLTHPKVLSSGTGHGELHFFSRYYHKMISRTSHIIPRKDTQQAFIDILKDRTNIRERNNGKKDITNSKNRNKIGFHSAPIYLFSGRKVPARMLCTAPWIKVIAILRNPIERAFSHYHFTHPPSRRKDDDPSFEEFIHSDIDLLKEHGVLRDWNATNFTKFAKSTKEYEAWESYLKIAKGSGPVGRGLYAIQLEIWMDEFQKYNKSIAEDLLILQSESSKEYPQESYHQAVQFFGLEPRTVAKHKHVLGKDHHATDYSGSDGMSDEMYRILYELFEPYNRRLYDLLGTEWEGVWDDAGGVNNTGIEVVEETE